MRQHQWQCKLSYCICIEPLLSSFHTVCLIGNMIQWSILKFLKSDVSFFANCILLRYKSLEKCNIIQKTRGFRERWTTKAQIRLCRCTIWSEPFMFPRSMYLPWGIYSTKCRLYLDRTTSQTIWRLHYSQKHCLSRAINIRLTENLSINFHFSQKNISRDPALEHFCCARDHNVSFHQKIRILN